jgi:hypothetical protein
MVTNLEDLLCTIDRVKPLVCELPTGSSVVFKYAMGRVGKFLTRLSTELSQAKTTPDVFNVIEKFHEHMGTRLTVLEGVNNKAEMSALMREMHAQIRDGLAELSNARFNPGEFYQIVDRHLNVIAGNLDAYRNATHKEFMCKIGGAIGDDDQALQWEAVGRIAAILENLKR